MFFPCLLKSGGASQGPWAPSGLGRFGNGEMLSPGRQQLPALEWLFLSCRCSHGDRHVLLFPRATTVLSANAVIWSFLEVDRVLSGYLTCDQPTRLFCRSLCLV